MKFHRQRHQIHLLEYELETLVVNMYENKLPRVILHMELFQCESILTPKNHIYYHPATFTLKEHNIASQKIFSARPRGYEALSLNVGAGWVDTTNRVVRPKKPFLEYVRRIPVTNSDFTQLHNAHYDTTIELYNLNELSRPALYLRKLGLNARNIHAQFRKGALQLVNSDPEKFFYKQPTLEPKLS